MAEYFTKDGDEFKKVEDTLFTQNEIDTNIIPSRLERERKKYADYDALKEKAGKVDTIKSEYETKLAEKDTTVSDLNKQLGAAKLDTDKVKIVHEFQLSDELAEFVTGDTVDDMRKKAEKLHKGIGVKGVNLNKKGKPTEKTSDSKKLAKTLFGSSSDD